MFKVIPERNLELSRHPSKQHMACLTETCPCCHWWVDSTGIGDILHDTVDIATVGKILSEKQEKIDALVAQNKELKVDCKKYQKANQNLRATNNKIKTVAVSDRPKGKPSGRPKGQQPTINRRPDTIDYEVPIDGHECPDCGGKLSDDVTDTYDRIVTITGMIKENVKFLINRRWCRKCKKQVRQPISGVNKHARRSSNHTAATVSLNMSGLSHERTAEYSKNVLGVKISDSAAYRDKISHSKRLKPEHDSIKQEILREKHLGCDEYWWPMGGKSGYVLVALGQNGCLMEVSDDRKIDTLKRFLPDYNGITKHDSYTGWNHIGSVHQMCMAHQIRLAKKEKKHGNPKNDVLAFLNELERTLRSYYAAHKIEDSHARRVAADCLDEQMRRLMNDTELVDDKQKTINKFRKRWRREGYYISTFLSISGLAPDSNDVERMNRRFVAIRGDGGGNRSETGKMANSILFTVLATCRVRGTSFYDVLALASGDG